MNATNDLRTALAALAAEYPEELRAAELADVSRQSFHVGLIVRNVPAGGTVCDIGGGVGLFSPGCADRGFQATLVDDFSDEVNRRFGEAALAPHRKRGVSVVSSDVTRDGVNLPPASFDAITSFDSIEHWHQGARRALHGALAALKPGGYFLLATPNCVNLRKRITVPLGHGKWSGFEAWYESEVFRGHVREPDVADLRAIARDLKLERTRVFGRNWIGTAHPHALIRVPSALADPALRLFPSLCSDIYVSGFKPG